MVAKQFKHTIKTFGGDIRGHICCIKPMDHFQHIHDIQTNGTGKVKCMNNK